MSSNVLNEILANVRKNILLSIENDILYNVLINTPNMDVNNMIYIILNYIYDINIEKIYIRNKITLECKKTCCITQMRYGIMHGLIKSYYIDNNNICIDGKYENGIIVNIIGYDIRGNIVLNK